MIRTWQGPRRIAFIPVWNRQVDSEPSTDFPDQVRARTFYDPDPNTGFDRSLQRYVQTVSSGRAHIEGEVFPTVAANDADTVGAALNSLPSSHEYTHAVAVLPHSAGQHRGGYAWYDGPATNGVPNFARVAMFNNPTLTNRDNLGVWAMEVLHIATSFGDLYNVSPQLGRYDVMACSCGTHPSAHTKSRIGWLRDEAVAQNPLGSNQNHRLHAVSLPQPPPPGRATAVRVESRHTSGHFMVEARLRTDDYESNSAISDGIPAEGVIVYEVQGDTEVFLRTSGGLQVGDSFEDAEENLKVSVRGREPGGFEIRVEAADFERCSDLAQRIEFLGQAIENESDINTKKQLISALQQAKREYQRLGCSLRQSPDNDAFLARFFRPRTRRASPGSRSGDVS